MKSVEMWEMSTEDFMNKLYDDYLQFAGDPKQHIDPDDVIEEEQFFKSGIAKFFAMNWARVSALVDSYEQISADKSFIIDLMYAYQKSIEKKEN